MYPPKSISIHIGTSPTRMVAASPRYRVKRSDYSQVFLVKPNAPTGGYVKINFHGSLQQQLEDMRYYVAVRHVAVFGTTLDEACVAREGFDKFYCPSPSTSSYGVSEFITQRLIWKSAEQCEKQKCLPHGSKLLCSSVRRCEENSDKDMIDSSESVKQPPLYTWVCHLEDSHKNRK